VAYAVVRDVAASWEQYECIADVMSEPAPAGLILHLAGPTDEGYRTIDLWESEQAWKTFSTTRLQEVVVALAAPFRPRSTVRGLRPINIVLGADRSAVAPALSKRKREEQ
jgi:hypothetical protein